MEIQYLGEHIIPGIIGKTFIWAGFLSALLSAVLYGLNCRKQSLHAVGIRKFARTSFLVHVASVLGSVLILYVLIFSHFFEYAYVWKYSSSELPVKYVISCFWAGQEGSLMIWTLFQSLVGFILLLVARDWEDHVLPVVAVSQVFMTSMLLGINAGGMMIGHSPFELLRNTIPDLHGTIFLQPDYLSLLKDGNGLNPLLENIWMTTHPPVLFLGYALTLVPFSFIIASLLRKDYQSWIKPALPWAIISMAVLGAGILLGGAWAYVSLTFGGFWSWDPVENSSLVPWLTLVAGVHFLFIARRQKYALPAAYLLIGLTYSLVLYASFLTRSGVLANSSAHSFSDNGMSAHLLTFFLVFLSILLILIFVNLRKMNEKKEDIFLSKELWMFTGSVVLVLAAFQILFNTSVPFINMIFGTHIALPLDHGRFYNTWQLPFGLMIAGFIACSQFLKYGNNLTVDFFRKMAVPFVFSVLASALLVLTGILYQAHYILLVFFALFAFFASLRSALLPGEKPWNYPAFITHIGFALFLIGIVLTFSNSRIISSNTSSYDLGDTRSNSENLVMVRGDTLAMDDYFVIYSNKIRRGNLSIYQMDFLKKENGALFKEFSLFPSINRNPGMGTVYNPDTRHFLWKDYYTYISYVGETPDYIVIRAIMNPWINILWFGALLLTAGPVWAFINRMRRTKINNT